MILRPGCSISRQGVHRNTRYRGTVGNLRYYESTMTLTEHSAHAVPAAGSCIRRTRGALQKSLAATAALLIVSSSLASAAGTLTADRRIYSDSLDYPVQYRVYLPESYDHDTDLPTIYVTDGQWYLEYGRMIEVLDREIAEGRIEPLIAVFVDSRNPNDLSENRRNQEFMCNQRYIRFFLDELLAEISANFPVSNERTQRVIAGLSFGGLNAACFGLMAADSFGGIAMQSPASAAHLKVISKLYESATPQPVKMFLSVGTRKDNTRATRKFHRMLEKKGYDVEYIEVPFAHEWANWQPLIDDMLYRFFSTP